MGQAHDAGQRALTVERQRTSVFMGLGAVALTLLIGLRYEVGADWRAYELYYEYAGLVGLTKLLTLDDPGYQLLNWAAQRAGLGLWAVNIMSGGLFTWGLLRFAHVQREPWLTIAVAVPYLVTVVAMGYSRQATAIGLLMGGMAAMANGASVLRFAWYVLLAATFHRTAVIVLPLVVLAVGDRNRLLNIIAGGAAFIAIYDAFLAGSVDELVRNYVSAEYQSQGALVRVVMNLVPAALFLLRSRSFAFSPSEARLWRLLSLAAFGMTVLLFVSASSTVVDRISLYLFPMQLAVLARLPTAFPGRGIRLLVIGYALTVQLVWLLFAVHAEYWLPYRFYPL